MCSPIAFIVAAIAIETSHPEWGPEPPVAPYTHARLPGERVVVDLIFPVLGPCRWSDTYDVERGAHRHTGTDIAASKMTPIVAPFSGILGLKRESFWIYGDSGWAMLGTHLNDDDLGTNNHRATRDAMFAPDLVAGQHVEAGQFIGYLGASGDATGPHLHFEIYTPGSGSTLPRIRNPFPSLKHARMIAHPTAVLPQADQKPDPGELRLQGCVRKVDPAKGEVTIILAAKQLPTSEAIPITAVRYVTLRPKPEAIERIGGWEGLQRLSPTTTVGFYIPLADGVSGADVRRILISPIRQAVAKRTRPKPQLTPLDVMLRTPPGRR